MDPGEQKPPQRTEALHPKARGLQFERDLDILAALHDGHLDAARVVADAFPAMAEAADAMVETLRSGGRLVFSGAGSAGLLAQTDGLELGGTFGLPDSAIVILMAGRSDDRSVLAGSVEDDAEQAARDAAAAAIAGTDCVLCISASGSTPYTLAVAARALDEGATVIGIAANEGSPLLAIAQVPILLATPPEIVAGSTRLGAGTAQKIALNMLSTLVGIRLGHVHDGYMVNLRADNEKLRSRAIRIVMEVGDCSERTATEALAATGWQVKPAVLLVLGARDAGEARRLVARAGGRLDAAIADLSGA